MNKVFSLWLREYLLVMCVVKGYCSFCSRCRILAEHILTTYSYNTLSNPAPCTSLLLKLHPALDVHATKIA